MTAKSVCWLVCLHMCHMHQLPTGKFIQEICTMQLHRNVLIILMLSTTIYSQIFYSILCIMQHVVIKLHVTCHYEQTFTITVTITVLLSVMEDITDFSMSGWGHINCLAKGFKAIHMSQTARYYYKSTKHKFVFPCANRLLMWKLEKLLVPTAKVSSVSGAHSLWRNTWWMLEKPAKQLIVMAGCILEI
jgi:hypothetical protein